MKLIEIAKADENLSTYSFRRVGMLKCGFYFEFDVKFTSEFEVSFFWEALSNDTVV